MVGLAIGAQAMSVSANSKSINLGSFIDLDGS